MSETVNQEATTTTATEPERTFTQTEVDAIVRDRLQRERNKYADYEAYKEKAEKFDAAEEAQKSELQKATERASALEAELTIPEVSQSVIITRPAGRTPKKELESIRSFSKHNATMCIFLGISMIDKVVDELLEGYTEDTPVAVVKKATWPDQEIIRGTLKDIAGKVKDANITKTAMIVVGDVLDPGDFTPSKLYDANFKHEYR